MPSIADDEFMAGTLTETEREFFEREADRPAFITKDSGEREQLANGMVRSPEGAKVDYGLAFDGPLFERWVALLSRGASIYGARNWMKALLAGPGLERDETKARYKRSAIRHFMQWWRGERDEDHAAAVIFNMNGLEAMLETDRKGK